MQAETAKTDAIGKALGWVRWGREQWLLLVFLAGSLMWLRDAVEAVRGVPADIAALGDGIAAVADGVERLETAHAEEAGRPGAAVAFPGDRHEIEDGAAGAWTVVRLRPARTLRGDCRTGAVDVWMIDARGRWFSVETGLAQVPRLSGDTDVAFGVRIPVDAAPGRAEALVQLTHECGVHREVQLAPRLHFRVRGAKAS